MIDLAKKFLHENIYFELYHHRAIYTNEDALVIKKEQGFTGTETKSLFLKDKKDNNYVYLTFTTKQTDFKALGRSSVKGFLLFHQNAWKNKRDKSRALFLRLVMKNRFRLLLMKSSYQMKNLFLHQVDQIKRWSSKRLT